MQMKIYKNRSVNMLISQTLDKIKRSGFKIWKAVKRKWNYFHLMKNNHFRSFCVEKEIYYFETTKALLTSTVVVGFL